MSKDDFTGHSPFPWTTVPHEEFKEWNRLIAADHISPGIMFGGYQEGPANTALVLAIPTLLKQRDDLLEALTELVALKDSKVKIADIQDNLWEGGTDVNVADANAKKALQLVADYSRRKPLAWERARTLIASLGEKSNG